MLCLDSINKQLGEMNMTDVSLEVNDGEYFVLLGPSGVGKTVLLEIIAGLIPPDNGKILWNNRDVTDLAPEKRGFAVVYQDYALFPHMTVKQNIQFGLKAMHLPPEQINERIDHLAQMLHIHNLLNQHVTTLSGGQQQRTALARALAVRPRLLLLDEPLSALETNIRLRLRKELKQITTKLNTSVIHVTHDPEEAMMLGTKIGVMLNHNIRQIGTPEELFRRPSDPEVTRFLGINNVLPVSGIHQNICNVCNQKIHVSSADDTIEHIWIKPEEILLSKGPFDSSARNQFKCKVIERDHHGSLLAIRVARGELTLTALITFASFEEMQLEIGSDVYATFKSSTVHCF